MFVVIRCIRNIEYSANSVSFGLFALEGFTPLEIIPHCFAVPPMVRSDFRIIPAGFNPLRQRLRGECPTGISSGVYTIAVFCYLFRNGKDHHPGSEGSQFKEY